MLAHGISAEYGRFSGGVVNVVTRSGGNFFSGSFREGLSNPSWIAQTPLEKRRATSSTPTSSARRTRARSAARSCATACGSSPPAASRRRTSPNTFAQNGAGYTRTDTNRRGEVKFTGTVAPAPDACRSASSRTRPTQANMSAIRRRGAARREHADHARSCRTGCSRANYNGARDAALLRARCSTRRSSRASATTAARAPTSSTRRSARWARTPACRAALVYNAPYLDANDPEQRNNRQITGSVAVPAVDAALRQPRAQGRRRVLRQHRHRRQLAVVDRLRVRDRLPDGRAARRARRARARRCPCFIAGRQRRSGTSRRRAARRSTSRRRRSTCRIAGS